MSKNTLAVFYHYFEANQSYKDNLIFFLSTAYIDCVDFYIVISGECSVELPHIENIKYIFTDNKNNDFGGYIAGLSELKGDDSYEYYIFINSSVRGPFVPDIYPYQWTKIFTDKLKNNVHLVGSSINILPDLEPSAIAFEQRFGYAKPYSHVQTTSYALTRTALKHLIDIGFYDVTDELTKDEVIYDYEIRLSQEIKRNGWDIKCFLPGYNSVDYGSSHENINFSARHGDPLYAGAYFGRTAHATELIFVKTNRNLILGSELASHTYTSLMCRTSSLSEWIERVSLLDRSLKSIVKIAKVKKKKSVLARVKRLMSIG